MLAPDAVSKAVGPEAYRELVQLGLKVQQLERDVIRLPQAQTVATAGAIAALGFVSTTLSGSVDQMAVWTGSLAIGGTSLLTIVDSDGDAVKDAVAITRIGSVSGGSAVMATFVDGSNSGADSVEFTIDPATQFTGLTTVQWKSTAATETVIYKSDITNLGTLENTTLVQFVTRDTNQTSGMTGNKVWSGTHQFGSTVGITGVLTASDVIEMSTGKSIHWPTLTPTTTAGVRIVKYDSIFSGENDPILTMGFNVTSGGARADTAIQQAVLQLEGNFLTGGIRTSELMWSFTDPSGNSFRPMLASVQATGASANEAQWDFRVNPTTLGISMNSSAVLILAPVTTSKTLTGTIGSGGFTTTNSNVTLSHSDNNSGVYYAFSGATTFNGAANSGIGSAIGVDGRATWSGSAASRTCTGLTGFSAIAVATQTGATPTIPGGGTIAGAQVGWQLTGQNMAWPIAYGMQVFGPGTTGALGPGSSISNNYGLWIDNFGGYGSAIDAALFIQAQTGGSGGVKGNLRMYGGDFNDGHIQLGSSPTAHFWLDASSSKLRLGSGTSAGIGIHDDGLMLVSGTRLMWGAAATTATASRTGALYEIAGGLVFEAGTTTVLALTSTQITVQPSIQWLMAASTTSRASINWNSGAAPTSLGEADEWYDSTQKTLIFGQGATPVKTAREGTLYVATATATVTNTTAETTLIGSGIGTMTLPASFLIAGKTLCIKASGVLSTDASAHTFRFKIKKGSTVILDTGASTPPNSLSGRVWRLYAEITGRSTTSVIGNGFIEFADATNGATSKAVSWEMNNGTTAVTIGTTSEAMDLTLTIGAGASASDSVSCTDLTMSVRM